MSCDHKWIKYTPFRGEAYEICDVIGCNKRKADYDLENVSTKMSDWSDALSEYSWMDNKIDDKPNTPPERYQVEDIHKIATHSTIDKLIKLVKGDK